MLELAVNGDERRVETDLLVRLAQRGLVRRLTGVHAPSGEADLAAMMAHLPRAPGEQHLGPVHGFGEQDQHRRVAGIGERRQHRSGGRWYGGEHLASVGDASSATTPADPATTASAVG